MLRLRAAKGVEYDGYDCETGYIAQKQSGKEAEEHNSMF
jgi:hypothetical protein